MKRAGILSKASLTGRLIALFVLMLAGRAFSSGTPKFAYVVNTFSGTVSAYTIDSTTGALTPVVGSPFATGRSPEGVAVDPSGRFAYVPSGGGVSAYTIDSATGALTPVVGSPFQPGTSLMR